MGKSMSTGVNHAPEREVCQYKICRGKQIPVCGLNFIVEAETQAAGGLQGQMNWGCITTKRTALCHHAGKVEEVWGVNERKSWLFIDVELAFSHRRNVSMSWRVPGRCIILRCIVPFRAVMTEQLWLISCRSDWSLNESGNGDIQSRNQSVNTALWWGCIRKKSLSFGQITSRITVLRRETCLSVSGARSNLPSTTKGF